MACNGAGKSAWKRETCDRLPEHYFDQDSIAGGIGDWNSESARARTREYINDQINQATAARRDFGIESTYSGRPGRAMVERAKAASYRVEGVYIGTDPRRSTRSRSTTGSRRTPATMWTRRGCPSGTDQLGAGPVVDLHAFLPGEVTHPLTTKVDCGVEDSERRRDS